MKTNSHLPRKLIFSFEESDQSCKMSHICLNLCQTNQIHVRWTLIFGLLRIQGLPMQCTARVREAQLWRLLAKHLSALPLSSKHPWLLKIGHLFLCFIEEKNKKVQSVQVYMIVSRNFWYSIIPSLSSNDFTKARSSSESLKLWYSKVSTNSFIQLVSRKLFHFTSFRK